MKKSFEKLGFELSDYSNIAEIIDFIRTSEDIPENQRETKFNYFLNNFAKIGNSLFKVDKIKAFIKEGIDFSAVTKTTYKVCIAIGLNDEELEKKYHIDTKKLFEKFVKSGIVVNEIDKNGNAISSCPIDKYEKFSGIDKCRLDFIVKNPSYSHETFTFPHDKGWSQKFKIHQVEKYYINQDLGLICYYNGGRHWELKDIGDTINYIKGLNDEGYNTEDTKEMLNILKEMKK